MFTYHQAYKHLIAYMTEVFLSSYLSQFFHYIFSFCFLALLTDKPPKPLFPMENQPTVIDVQLGKSPSGNNRSYTSTLVADRKIESAKKALTALLLHANQFAASHL